MKVKFLEDDIVTDVQQHNISTKLTLEVNVNISTLLATCIEFEAFSLS